MKSVRVLLLLVVCTFVTGCGEIEGSLDLKIINVRLINIYDDNFELEGNISGVLSFIDGHIEGENKNEYVELLELTLKDDFGDIYVIVVPSKEVRFRDNIEVGRVYVEFWALEGDFSDYYELCGRGKDDSVSKWILNNLFTSKAIRKRDIVLPYSEYERLKK